MERGESDEDAIARELREEAGLRDFSRLGCIWTRTHWFPMSAHSGQAERIYLVEAAGAEPRPELGWDELRAEWMTDIRWWTREEIDAYDGVFSPRRLKELLRELDEHGLPSEPVDVGV